MKGMKGCDVGQHGVGAHIGGGALNSRPLPMKHLVICILSLAALIRHSMYPLYKYKYKYMFKYTRHLMRTVVPRLRRAQWQKGESLLANARIDAFCHEGCNAAHIRTVSFSQWDSHQPHPHPPPRPSPCSSPCSPPRPSPRPSPCSSPCPPPCSSPHPSPCSSPRPSPCSPPSPPPSSKPTPQCSSPFSHPPHPCLYLHPV